MINHINAGRPQCPVGLNTLVLPSKGSPNLRERHPYVYLFCGHVHGKHEWGQGDSEHRTCPLCLKVTHSYWCVKLVTVVKPVCFLLLVSSSVSVRVSFKERLYPESIHF